MNLLSNSFYKIKSIKIVKSEQILHKWDAIRPHRNARPQRRLQSNCQRSTQTKRSQRLSRLRKPSDRIAAYRCMITACQFKGERRLRLHPLPGSNQTAISFQITCDQPEHQHSCFGLEDSSPEHEPICSMQGRSITRHQPACLTAGNSRPKHEPSCLTLETSLSPHKSPSFPLAEGLIADTPSFCGAHNRSALPGSACAMRKKGGLKAQAG